VRHLTSNALNVIVNN